MEKSIIHTFALSGKEAAGLEFLSGEEATGLESGEEAAGLESGEEVAGRSRLVFSELCILSSRTVKNSWVACSELSENLWTVLPTSCCVQEFSYALHWSLPLTCTCRLVHTLLVS